MINPNRYALSVSIPLSPYFSLVFFLNTCSIIAEAILYANITGTAFPMTLYIAVMFRAVSVKN